MILFPRQNVIRNLTTRDDKEFLLSPQGFVFATALNVLRTPALRFTSPQTLQIHSVCAKLPADEGVRVPGDTIL